jgi:hypothetical protein
MQVGEMFDNDDNRNIQIAVEHLNDLPDTNRLKPRVWAIHKSKTDRYGFSLGVGSFVRPLYLYTKLNHIIHLDVKNGPVEDVKNDTVKDVIAFRMNARMQATRKIDPCVSCQSFYGFMSCAPIGNCAEYDVIQNVRRDLLESPEETNSKFKSAYEQHLAAFGKMLEMVEKDRGRSAKEKIEKYFKDTRCPLKPNVLMYQRQQSSGNYDVVIKLIVTDDYPLPRTK